MKIRKQTDTYLYNFENLTMQQIKMINDALLKHDFNFKYSKELEINLRITIQIFLNKQK